MNFLALFFLKPVLFNTFLILISESMQFCQLYSQDVASSSEMCTKDADQKQM